MFGAGFALVLAILVVVYRDVGAVKAARMAALDAAPPGSVVQLARFRGASRWFFGEDLDPPNKSAEVAVVFKLAKVELRARD